MEYFVTTKNIRQLLTTAKISLGRNANQNSELENFLVNFFNGSNIEKRFYTAEEAQNFLFKAKRASILIFPDLSFSSVATVTETIKNTNTATITALSNAYRTFYSSYDSISTVETENGRVQETKDLSLKLRDWIKKIVGKYDDIFEALTSENLEKLTDVATLYRILKPYMPKSEYNKTKKIIVRHTDKVIDKILSNKFLEEFDPLIAKEVLESLTDSKLGLDRFTDKELAKLIKQASSILYKSNKDKIEATQKVIEQYRNHLLVAADDDELFKDVINQNISFKALVSRAGTILNGSVDTQNANYLLLTGETINKVHKHFDKKVFPGIEKEDIDKYGRVKINMQPYDLYHLLTNNTSILSLLSPSRMIQISKEFDQVIEEAFNQTHKTLRFKPENFKLEKFITRQNLPELIYNFENNPAFIKNFAENIINLNKVMRDTEIFKVMQNNITLFMQDSESVQKDIAAICNSSPDIKTLSYKINKYVNSKFSYDKKRSKTKDGKAQTSTIPDEASTNKTEDTIELPIDDSFTVVVDGGIIEKPKLFSQELKTYTIEDCVDKLQGIIDDLQQELDDHQTNDEQETYNLNITKTRETMSHTEKLFNRCEELVAPLHQTQKNVAMQYEKVLNILRKKFQDIHDSCRIYMSFINAEKPYVGRGKEHHVWADEKGSATTQLPKVIKEVSTIKDPELREQLLAAIKKSAKDNRNVIRNENIQANLERIARDNDSLKLNEFYAFCSIVADSIDRKILNKEDDEKTL